MPYGNPKNSKKQARMSGGYWEHYMMETPESTDGPSDYNDDRYASKSGGKPGTSLKLRAGLMSGPPKM